MKGYSGNFDRETCASARVEGVDASYKDLAQVCGSIRNRDSQWARAFLERAAKGEIPVRYRKHNRKLGHRRELGGKKGRYPEKAAGIVLKALNSAIANGVVKGLGDEYVVQVATANKKDTYPRMAPKGRTARSYYVTSRIELVLKSKGETEVPKGAEVSAPTKAEEKKPEKQAEAKEGNAPAHVVKEKKESVPPKHPPHEEHKHEVEKEAEAAHAHRNDRNAVEHSRGKKEVIKG